MKKTIILVAAIALISMSFVGVKEIIVNKSQAKVTSSAIKWKGYKPTGSHAGTINLLSGDLKMDGKNLKGGSFVADMSSIKDEDGSAKLEGHLKSEDFFEVETYTTSKFEITKSEMVNGKNQITGDLTIKDITKQITFSASVTVSDNSVTLTSETIKINRADFNVKYKSKSFFNDLKDKFVNDEFDLQVTIVSEM